MGKLCPVCGIENSDTAIRCEVCGEKFDFGRDDKKNTESLNYEKSILILTKIPSEESIRIEESSIIGRRGDIGREVIADDEHVGEYHCVAIREGVHWKIEDLHSLNGTMVDNERLVPNVKLEVHNGQKLRIADLLFEISILGETNKATDKIKVQNEEWHIICPICGKDYRVPDKDGRILECMNCSDYDKHEIAEIRPVRKYVD